MSRARFHVLAVMVKHSGVVGEAQLIDAHFQTLPRDDQSLEDESEGGTPHPSRMLVNCWRAALKVMGWVVAIKQSTGQAFEALAEPLLAKVSLDFAA